MRKKRLPLVLVLAIASGLLSGYLALNFLRNQTSNLIAAEPVASGKVVVAAKDLPLGTVLRSQDVRMIDWPGDALPTGYAAAPGDVVGRGLITSVSANEPLLEVKLAPKGVGGGLAVSIPDGMRALSVRVDEVVGVAGFVLPGTRVDVLATIEPDQASGQERTVTKVILQNVQTLAAGQKVERDMEGKPQTVTVITLLVTPEQAERLTLASNEGRIQLALRNMLDIAEVETPGVRPAALITSPSANPGRAVRVGPRRSRETGVTVIEMYRGGERTLSTFSPRNP